MKFRFDFLVNPEGSRHEHKLSSRTPFRTNIDVGKHSSDLVEKRTVDDVPEPSQWVVYG